MQFYYITRETRLCWKLVDFKTIWLLLPCSIFAKVIPDQKFGIAAIVEWSFHSSPLTHFKIVYLALWTIHYFPLCCPFLTYETPQACRYSISISTEHVQTTYMLLFHQLWHTMPLIWGWIIFIQFVSHCKKEFPLKESLSKNKHFLSSL